MVEEIGSGAAAYLNAAMSAAAPRAEVKTERLEIRDTKSEDKGETPPSKQAVQVQISQEAKEMAADPRQEKTLEA